MPRVVSDPKKTADPPTKAAEAKPEPPKPEPAPKAADKAELAQADPKEPGKEEAKKEEPKKEEPKADPLADVKTAVEKAAGTASDGVKRGDTAWVLSASALVLLMTPGLALFRSEERRVGKEWRSRVTRSA